MKKIIMLVMAMIAGAVFADGFIERYRGPLIGNAAHPRKVFDSLDLSRYSVRAVANGTADKYRGVYSICSGAARVDYFPIGQRYSAEEHRLYAKLQTFYLYTGNAAYQTLQVNIVLEERQDGVYAWMSDMYQSNLGNDGAWYPYVWGVWSDLPALGPVGSTRRFANATYGYDWEDIDGTFSKGFGVDNILLGRNDAAETAITNLAADPIAVNGNCVIENPGSVTISSGISGEGDLTYRATTAPEVSDTVEVGADVSLTTSWQKVAPGRLLSKLTSVTALTAGTRAGDGRTPGGYAHWRNNGGFCVSQIYTPWSSYYQTGVVLYLRQSGPDIWARIAPYSFTRPGDNGHPQEGYVYGEIDFEKDYAADPSKFQSVQPSQVSIRDLKLHFAAGSAMQVVNSTGVNSMATGSVVRVVGTASAPMGVNFNTPTDNRGTSVYGGVEIGAGGNAFFSKAVLPKWIYAHDGGAIYQASNQCFSAGSCNLRLNGGKLYLGYQAMSGSIKDVDDAYTYVNYLRLENGSEVIGRQPRIGPSGTANPYWKVTGSSPSSASCGMLFLPVNMAVSPLVLDVDDVTGSAAVDFSMSGPIAYHESANGMSGIIKTGAGTFAMNAAYSLNGPNEVKAGTWRFGVAEAANEFTPFKLSGGDLEIAAGVRLEMHSLEAEADAEVRLEPGAKLTLGYALEDNEQSGIIDFRGSGALDAQAVRIGTSQCLTTDQLARIRIMGRAVTQDSDGYLVSGIRPLLLIVR